MNIRQSLEFFAASGTRKKSRLQIAREVIMAEVESEATPRKWADEWLSSESFVLASLPIGRVAMPQPPLEKNVLRQLNASTPGLVVIDTNKKKLCRAAGSGFVPQTLMVVGGDVQAAAQRQGEEVILAWVGERALKHLKLAENKVTIQATKVFGGAVMNLKQTVNLYGAGSSIIKPNPSPGSGNGPQIKDKLPPKSELAAALEAGDARPMVHAFMQACNSGYVPKVGAVSPPGMEHVVKGLKKSKVDNPWAVAWWLHDKED